MDHGFMVVSIHKHSPILDDWGYQFNLVGGAITILKNDGVRQWVSDDIPYTKWNIQFMFQTTNQ